MVISSIYHLSRFLRLDGVPLRAGAEIARHAALVPHGSRPELEANTLQGRPFTPATKLRRTWHAEISTMASSYIGYLKQT